MEERPSQTEIGETAPGLEESPTENARLQTFLEEMENARSLHSPLGYVPPDEFEAHYLKC